ncbi:MULTISPECIES: substrate-binding domain-containing protein [unclassified Pseudomonas]|uniref:substrate-binding domain-containing protein n=1 Tax=unclassified Pseudomonas TaxID=196821 RepID=UPI000DA8F85C|nr:MULTISPECIES: substrate-binding domain-containing protein [unclassified Pseudomonas]MDW3716622.1 substrate-binding domain-containing protein [Pseudomonas sp. 2023EL-01195]PZE12191.1 ABC transporter substrate-binding protein [Pseudomonas sp. 57B-090624]
MKVFAKRLVALAFGLCAIHATARAEELNVMTSGGFTAAFKLLSPPYAQSSGDTVNTILGPSMGNAREAIPNRLARGEHADVVIMVGYALDELIKQGKVDPASRVELADSRIGMVVKQGAPKPSIDTEQALKRTLLSARALAYSDSASGVYIKNELFRKLGVQQQVGPKARMIERIPVASTVASGEVEMGFQQVAELLPVPGVTFVGKIPESLQSVTRYSAGIPRNAEHPERAKALLAYLSSPAAQPVVRSTGLDSIPR